MMKNPYLFLRRSQVSRYRVPFSLDVYSSLRACRFHVLCSLASSLDPGTQPEETENISFIAAVPVECVLSYQIYLRHPS